MKQEKIHIHYDADGDYLEIRFGSVRPSYDEYVGNDTFEHRDRKTDDVLGYAFYNVQKRKSDKPCDISVPDAKSQQIGCF